MKLKINNPEKFNEDVLAILLEQSPSEGKTAVSSIADGLRFRNWKLSGNRVDLEDTLRAQGFTVTEIKNAKGQTTRVLVSL